MCGRGHPALLINARPGDRLRCCWRIRKLSGFLHFRKDVRIVGVIFNKVGSERHQEMLRQVCTDLSITCYGFLPKHAELEQGSRYLGLDFSEDTKDDALVKLLEENVQWEKLLKL